MLRPGHTFDNVRLYKDWAPTEFDHKGAFLGGDTPRRNWIVAPVCRTRDTGPLEDSNFETALKILGGEGDRVEVHRFGHWGPGWFEIILVHPRLVYQVEELQGCLEEYAILDEGDYSDREHEKATEYWEGMGTRERVGWCQQYRVSVFAARRDEIPSDPNGELLSALAN
jgi:hypothetical protein